VKDNLDSIFERVNFPFDIDLLSIDIDSTDYEVWKSIKKINPKVVIIEADNSVPEWVDKPIYPTHSNGGANTHILKRLGKEKGYTFACNTGNMFFVRNDLANVIQTDERAFPWWIDEKYRVMFSALNQLKTIDAIEAYCSTMHLNNDDLTTYISNTIEPEYQKNMAKSLANYMKGWALGFNIKAVSTE
jgi:hypothetical protein